MAIPAHDDSTAFQFHGSWREFAPIAFTNLLLSIVTLGIYRFWATTRTRNYLWSRTRFIDERLEWTGKGVELMIGFFIAIILFGIPVIMLKFGLQALALRGHVALAGILFFPLYGALLYIFGLARFRALRYRLSRTFWHGIRGGSENGGWGYGWSSIWKSVIGMFALGLLIPWSMVSLWNERWSAMSFGPHHFTSRAQSGPLMGRFLLFYLLPVAGCVALIGGVATAVATGVTATPGSASATGILFVVLGVIAGYFAIGVIMLAYYAAFFREAVGNLGLGGIDFNFSARTSDWLKLLLGDVVLVVCTLGIGVIFLTYRHWKFLITHLEAGGEIDLDTLTQSTAPLPKQGEGLLDAFDVGAF